MILFNGTDYAHNILENVKYYAQLYAKDYQRIRIASILFEEDVGSRLYAEIKQEQANMLGIEYELHTFSLNDNFQDILETLAQLNQDTSIVGIIIQKPWRRTWEASVSYEVRENGYDAWWYTLYSAIDPTKDVDGLHPETIESIKDGSWKEKGKVLPATCRAVLYILEEAEKLEAFGTKKISIIGRSDLLGIPLYYVLKKEGREVELLGKKDLDKRIRSGDNLFDSSIIVSATGVQHLINAEMIAEKTVLIDVGEPKPDIDSQSVATKASFLTPVPGGVGPLTVACLMQNALYLAMRRLRSPETY